jgi:6-pyruvoyltetrahydropterin/6-carboxytetrahydropterin synthase
LIIEIEGDVDRFGWVCDFAELEEITKRSVIDRFDHKNINDYLDVPTVENIAGSIFQMLDTELKSKPYRLSKVLLYETADCYAEVAR